MPSKHRKKHFDPTLGLVILFVLLGVGFLSYPRVSDFVVNYEIRKQQRAFETYRQELAAKQAEIEANRRLDFNAEQDTKRALKEAWDELLQSGQLERTGNVYGSREQMLTLGNIVIPSIGVNMTIHDGTSDAILDVGAGLLESSDLPTGGVGRHTILTAHSGLPNVRYFTDVEKMKVGDLVFVENFKEVLAYRFFDHRVVDPHDVEDLKRQEGKDLLTLVTCTPIGVNSHRYLAFCERTEFAPEVKRIYEQQIQADQHTEEKTDWFLEHLWILLIALIFILILIVCWWYMRKRRKAEKAQTG